MAKRGVILLAVGFLAPVLAPSVSPAQTLTPGTQPTAAAATTAVTPAAILPVPAADKLAVSSLPGTLPGTASPEKALPKVFAPTRPRTTYTRYPWKRRILGTVFWVGERPTANNPTPNNKSAWDQQWEKNFGGYDNPNRSKREGFIPKDFIPAQNPFYIALPYNDLKTGGVGTKNSARHMIPWFDREFRRGGKTIIKGRWLAIRRGSKVCYAQWEDVGPFETDDWEYVFGDDRPKTSGNGGAGIDFSPAVRDYLGFSTRGICDWRFVDEEEVPDGPWKQYGDNNPFAKQRKGAGESARDIEQIVKIREMRDQYLNEMPMAR